MPMGILALRVIVPITAWQQRFEGWDWLIRLDPDAANGLDKCSVADTFQVRSVSTKRLVRRLGQLTNADMKRVAEGLRTVFEL